MMTPSLNTYVVGTLAAILATRLPVELLHLDGRLDVALTIGALAAVVYGLTPRRHWDQAKRLWGMVFLALVALIAGSFAGTLVGMMAGFPVMFTAAFSGVGSIGFAVSLIVALVAACIAYFFVFRLGWPLVEPRDEPAQPFRLF